MMPSDGFVAAAAQLVIEYIVCSELCVFVLCRTSKRVTRETTSLGSLSHQLQPIRPEGNSVSLSNFRLKN